MNEQSKSSAQSYQSDLQYLERNFNSYTAELVLKNKSEI
jgi:hypothetical protein